MHRRNILIFHQAALGDFIVTWPLAMALSRIFPQSRVIYVTHSQKGALAERVLRIESADSEAGWHALLVPDLPQLPERSAKLLAGAHTVVSFTAGQQDPFAQGIARIAPHAQIISLDTKQPGQGHVTESLREQLEAWPMIACALGQMLRSVADRGVGFGRTARDRIVVHPGAGKEASRWPAERFLELVKRLSDEGDSVRVLLGEAELERWPSQLVARFEDAAAVCWPATLIELLDEIAAAEVFVGNDSGPGHLAATIGVPTVSLFGPGDPVRWRPLGPCVTVVHAATIDGIEVDEVYQALTACSNGTNRNPG